MSIAEGCEEHGNRRFAGVFTSALQPRRIEWSQRQERGLAVGRAGNNRSRMLILNTCARGCDGVLAERHREQDGASCTKSSGSKLLTIDRSRTKLSSHARMRPDETCSLRLPHLPSVLTNMATICTAKRPLALQSQKTYLVGYMYTKE
jgi:hypothetical protein